MNLTSDSQLNEIDRTSIFDEASFFDLSAQKKFPTQNPINKIVETVDEALAQRGFLSGSLNLPTIQPLTNEDTEIIYTLTYEPLSSISQTSDERNREGEVFRQAAFIVWIHTQADISNATQCVLKVKPFVRINYPRDNNDWTNTVPDTALKEAEAIAEYIKDSNMSK